MVPGMNYVFIQDIYASIAKKINKKSMKQAMVAAYYLFML